MQLEANIEYRYDIARIIPNTLTLRGAVFTDIGNIWNIRSTKANGITDVLSDGDGQLLSEITGP